MRARVAAVLLVLCAPTAAVADTTDAIAVWHEAHPDHALLTVWLDKKEDWRGTGFANRSPSRLDDLLKTSFGSAIFRPGDLSTTDARAYVEANGWPGHDSLTGKVMFILTADASTEGNKRLRDYVSQELGSAYAFVAPYAVVKSQVTKQPNTFTPETTAWVVVYNFEWVDAFDDGECDGNECFQVPTAHDLYFFARVWDIDDPIEADHASKGPFGGRYGYANFVAVDHPWQHGEDRGYGNYPDGTYPP